MSLTEDERTELRDLLAALDRQRTCGAIARAVHDAIAYAIVTARTDTAARQLVHLLEARRERLGPALLDVANAALANTCTRPATVTATAELRGYRRMLRWMAVRRRPDRVRDGDPDLFEVVTHETNLDALAFQALYLVDCEFRAVSLVGAAFDDAVLVNCDLSRSNLARTTWRRARLVRCDLSATTLTDAILDDATLEDCNLRGADLGAVNLGARVTTQRTQFLRADLRETSWQCRVLDGTGFDRCLWHGVHGQPVIGRVAIDAPDVSPAGDGSLLGTAAAILSALTSAARPRL